MAVSEPAAGDPAEQLVRTHPSTVLVRTLTMIWQTIGVLFGLLVFGSLGGSGGLMAAAGLGGTAVLVVAVTAGVQWFNWLYFRYGIVDRHLLIHEGWLVRKRRSIPLARVQGVDVRADLVMRFLGMADVIVQTAGGGAGEPEAKIGAVSLFEAERLRTALLHGRAGIGTTGTERVMGADPVGRMSDLRGVFGGTEQAVLQPKFEYRLGVGRLVLAGLTSKSVPLIMAASLGAASQLIDVAGDAVFDSAAQAVTATGIIGALLGGLALLVGVTALAVVVSVTRDFGFTVRRVEDRIETEAGLFERRMTGMPVRRIQTVSIEQSPLRRMLGYVSVDVVTAGFGRGEEQQATTAASVVPLAMKSELYGLMRELLPEAQAFPELHPLPRRAIRFYVFLPTLATLLVTVAFAALVSLLSQAGSGIAVLVGGQLAIAVAGWSYAEWAQTSLGTDARSLGFARGVLGRYRVRVPRSRIQSLSIKQNPFQRRAGLATVIVATVSGSSKALYRVRHVAHSEADRIVAWYATRAV